jgi:hypothetical protein
MAFDSMQDGNYSGLQTSNAPTSASSGPSAQGRVQVTLTTGTTVVYWLVSPSEAFFVDDSTSVVEEGTAQLQTASSFSASTLNGQFALVMGGIDSPGEQLARVGTLEFSGSGNSTLEELANDSGSGEGAQSPGTLSGNYQVGGSGRITASLSNSSGGLDVVMYAVSGSQAYALQIDEGENTSGAIQLQQQ